MTAQGLLMPRRRAVPPEVERVPVISNTRLAMAAVITAETMLFAGMIGAYLVFRLAAPTWPPPDQPRLPLAVTTGNTLLLFASLVPLHRALRAVRAGDNAAALTGLNWTAALGSAFLAIQGAEWVRLLRHGLTPSASVYGGTFYLLIGCHAFHVLTAVVWLAGVTVLASRGAFSAQRHAALEMCGVYWYFVCGLWAVLFPLVYLY